MLVSQTCPVELTNNYINRFYTLVNPTNSLLLQRFIEPQSKLKKTFLLKLI